MDVDSEQILLRVYLRNTDKHGWLGQAATDALVEEARKRRLAGALVLRGICGLDITGHLLESSGWSIVDHVPMIVEFIDRPQAIGAFLPELEQYVAEGLATVGRIHVLLHRRISSIEDIPRTTIAQVPQIPKTSLSSLLPDEEYPMMKTSEAGQLLRVFIGESDESEGMSLYRAIVLKASELGLAGATVLRGPMGFGANSKIHTSKILEMSTDLPIIVEMVDSTEKIQSILPYLDEVIGQGMVTVEEVRVFRYGKGAGTSPSEPPA